MQRFFGGGAFLVFVFVFVDDLFRAGQTMALARNKEAAVQQGRGSLVGSVVGVGTHRSNYGAKQPASKCLP